LRENLHCCIATIEIVPEQETMSIYFCCIATKIYSKRKIQLKQNITLLKTVDRQISASVNAANFRLSDRAQQARHFGKSAATPGVRHVDGRK